MLIGIIFVALATLAAHWSFSWIGYNPTDDGFTLAYSRRLLDGQIPHLEFIILRPYLSPVLHMLWVWAAGESMYWWSRAFVWFQWASMAWLWTMTINRMAGRPFRMIDCVLVSLIGLVFSANIWAVMAWHTIDGLWLATLGVALICGRSRRQLRFLGYLLLGTAYLCKQSFLLSAPLVLLIHRDWRDFRLWLGAALPGIAYVVYLALTGALWDAYLQLTAYSSLANVLDANARGLTMYIFFGYLAFRLVEGTPAIAGLTNHPRLAAGAGAGLVAGVAALDIITPAFTYGDISTASYTLVALLLGGALYFVLEARRGNPFLQLILMVLVLAWSVTVSVGAKTPALMAGAMVGVLLAGILPAVCRPPWRTVVLLILAGLAVAGLYSIRYRKVYMDQPAAQLTYALDGVFPGARGIKTNPNTYAFLADLQQAVAQARQYPDPYAILPDIPGYWARAAQRNPLPIDWAKDTELPDSFLLQRLTDAIDAQRPHLTVIVQKVQAFPLRDGFKKLGSSDKFAAARHVRQQFKKCGETKYFELYR